MPNRISLGILAACFILCSFPCSSVAQTSITLDDAIAMAATTSLEQSSARNALQSMLWDYHSFKAALKPKLSLNTSFPNYTRAVSSVISPEGKEIFVNQNQSYNNMRLDASQNILLTGGTLSVYSSLSRIDNFGIQHYKQHATIPVSLSYVQRSIFFNPLKWQHKIMPLNLEIGKREYNERMENLSLKTVDYFFSLLEAETNIQSEVLNMKTADTLCKMIKMKNAIGVKDKNSLLQAEMNYLNALKGYNQSGILVEIARQQLSRFLKLAAGTPVTLQIPQPEFFDKIDISDAIAKATDNRKTMLEFKRRKLEADKNVKEIKSESGIAMGVQVHLGFSQTDENLGRAYSNLENQQTISVSMSVPIIDWGVSRFRIKKALNDKEFIENETEQGKLAFEQEIRIEVMQWNNIQQDIDIAEKLKNISLERYDISKQKYIAGLISFTEYNISQQERTSAQLSYINKLRKYWTLYYRIRMLTLYDYRLRNNIVH